MTDDVQLQQDVWIAFPVSSHKETEDNPYSLSPSLRENGWQGIIDRVIRPSYEYGFRTIALHRMMGECDQGDKMDFDSRVDILEEDEPSREYFSSKSIQGFLDDVHKEFPDLKLVVYFGTFYDLDFDKRLESGGFLSWIDRARRSMIPVLDSPFCEMAFDAAAGYTTDTPQFHFVRMIESLKATQGLETYVEALPDQSRPQNWDMSAICLERFWTRLIKRFPDWKEKLTGNSYVRWWNGHSYGPADNNYNDDIVAWAKGCIADDTIPCFGFQQLFNDNYLETGKPVYKQFSNIRDLLGTHSYPTIPLTPAEEAEQAEADKEKAKKNERS